jgi:hypothetical protein
VELCTYRSVHSRSIILLLRKRWTNNDNRAFEPASVPTVLKEPNESLKWIQGFNILGFGDGSHLRVFNEFHEEIGEMYAELANLGRDVERGQSPAILKDIELRRYELRDKIKLTEGARKHARKNLQASVELKLKKGELVAQGFQLPIEKNARASEIPESYWRFLSLSEDLSGASGQGIEYTGLAVARLG